MTKDIIISPIIKDPDPTPHNLRKTLSAEWLHDTPDGHAQSSSLHHRKSMGAIRTSETAFHERATSPTKTITKPFMFATARRAAEREAKVRGSPTSPVKGSPDPSKLAKGKTAKPHQSTFLHSHASSISTTDTAFHTAQASPTHSISALSYATAAEHHGGMTSAPGSPSRIPRLALKVRRGRTRTGHTDQTTQLPEILQVQLTLSGSAEESESGDGAKQHGIVELFENSTDHSITSEGADTNGSTKSSDIACFSETIMQDEEGTGARHGTVRLRPQNYTGDDTSLLSTFKAHDQGKSHQSGTESRTAVDELRASLTIMKPELDAVSDQAESVQSTQWPAHDSNDHANLQKTYIESNDSTRRAAPASMHDPAILYKGHERREVFRSAPELLSLLRKRSATLPSKVALSAAAKVALNAEAKVFVPMGNPGGSWKQSPFNRTPLPSEVIHPEWRTEMPAVEASATDYSVRPPFLSENVQQNIRPLIERSQTWKGKSGASPKRKSPKKSWQQPKKHRRFVSAHSEPDGNTITQASYREWTKKNINVPKREWNLQWYDGAWKSVNGAPPTFESFYADRAQRMPSDDGSIVTNPYQGRTSSRGSRSTTADSGPEQHLGHGAIEACGHWDVTMAGEFGNGVCHECSP